ncbi:MAG: hypothetical protein AB1679_03080 [Actinomycetota bacterium]
MIALRGRPVSLAVAGTVLALGPVAGWVAPAAGESRFSGTFAGLAAADGVRVTLVQPGVTLTKTLVDLGGPSAQAAVNSLGESRAFASFPYPGDTVAGAHGLLRGAGNIPAPAYPLYISSDHPAAPQAEAGDGPYRLQAQSTEAASKSLANVGLRIEGLGDLGLSRSESSVESTAERVAAHARTETSAFSVGPLRIGRVLSVADIVLGQDGLLTRNASTTVVGAMVGNAPVEITAGGVSVAGAAGPAADLGAVNEALKGAGITVELLPKAESPTGVTSPALRITSQDKSGSAITYVLGRASASVEGTASSPIIEESGSTATPDPGTEGSAPAPSAAEPAIAQAEFPAETTESPSVDDELVMEVPAVTDSAFGSGDALFGDSGAGAPVFAGRSGPVSEAELAESAAPTVRLTPPRRMAPVARGADSRVAILATRALLNGGDTRPLYGAALAGLGLCLALAVGLRFFARAARSGER